MSKLSKSILDTIHSKKIHPRSKWYFFGLHALLWGSFGLTLFIGIVAVSLIFLEMGMPERPYMDWMPLPGPLRILPYLPFLWGFGALLCVAIAYFVFYRTDRGYRMPTLWIVGILIVGSFSGGYALHRTKINSLGERQIQRFVPPYARMRADFQKGIPLPEAGILPGKIQSMDGAAYTVRCPDKALWKVTLNCSTEACKEQQKNIKLNQPMIFTGAIQGDKIEKNFEATDVDTPPHKECKNNKKDASCGRAFMSPPPKENSNKKD